MSKIYIYIYIIKYINVTILCQKKKKIQLNFKL